MVQKGILLVMVLFSFSYAVDNDDLKPRAMDRLQDIAGTYAGTLFASGYDMPVVTTFYWQGDTLCGEYIMDEEGTMTTGQFTGITFTQDHTIVCQWTDVYGTGPASFTFTDDYSGFAGYWSSDGIDGYNWWGSKEPLDDLQQTIQIE